MLFSFSTECIFFCIKKILIFVSLFLLSPHHHPVIVYCKNEQLETEVFSQFTKVKCSKSSMWVTSLIEILMLLAYF